MKKGLNYWRIKSGDATLLLSCTWSLKNWRAKNFHINEPCYFYKYRNTPFTSSLWVIFSTFLLSSVSSFSNSPLFHRRSLSLVQLFYHLLKVYRFPFWFIRSPTSPSVLSSKLSSKIFTVSSLFHNFLFLLCFLETGFLNDSTTIFRNEVYMFDFIPRMKFSSHYVKHINFL